MPLMKHKLALAVAALLLLAACAKDPGLVGVRAMNAKKDVDFTARTEADVSGREEGNATEPSMPDITAPLTLNGAVVYALANNLDAAVSKAEEDVQRERATAAMLRMLPSLIVDVEQSWKSRDIPSKSVNYATGETSLVPSISSEKHTSTEDVELSWDLLDLAINVNRWEQSKSRIQIRKLQLERVKQNLALDVTAAYFRAVVAKDSAGRAETVISYAMKRNTIIDEQMEKGHIPRIDGLQSNIDIAELLIRLTKYKDEYKAAKAELARLLGISPSTDYTLAPVDFDDVPGPLNVDPEDLSREAVLNRPELFELDIEEDITAKDAEIGIMQMFPNLTPFVRYNHDANKYLTRHDWFVSGLRLSWDLLGIPRAYAERQTALSRSRLVRKRRMNMAMAVLTQLRLAMIEYDNYRRQVGQTLELEGLRKELAIEVNHQVETGRLKESTLLNADQLYVVAHRARLTAFARLVTAKQRILNSLGRDWGEYGNEIAPSANLKVSLQ